MKKLLLNLTMLLVALVCGGVTYGAETESVTVYYQDYQNATATDWTSKNYQTGLSINTDGNNRYNAFTAANNNKRSAYNWFASTLNLSELSSYKLSFKFCVGALPSGKAGQPSEWVIAGSNSKTVDNENHNSTSIYYLVLSQKTLEKAEYSVQVGTKTLDETVTLTVGTWYTVTQEISSGSVKTVISDGTTDKFTNTNEEGFATIGQLKGINLLSGRYEGQQYVDDILITKEVEAGSVETPTASITAVNGTSRTITFNCATDGATLSYSTDGGSKFTDGNSLVISENTSVIVKATKGSVTAQSEKQEFEAGTEVELAGPTVNVTALTKDASGLYYQTLNGSCDNSSVLLAPTAILAAKFNDETVTLPYAATGNGTLTITASATGYKSSEVKYTVVGYGKNILCDYTKTEVTELPATGMKKVSSDQLGTHFTYEEGKGLKAVRTDNNPWFVFNGTGMVGYDVNNNGTVSENFNGSYKGTNNDLLYVSKGAYLERVYSFVEARAIALNTAHTYTTYCSDVDLDFTNVEGVEVYKVKVSGNKAVSTKVEGKIQAGEGILLKKTGDATTVTVPTTTGAEKLTDNDLVGAKEAITDGWDNMNAYMLVSDTEFQKIGTGTLAKGKAYLLISDNVATKNQSIYFGDEVNSDDPVTAINGVADNADAQNGAIYTLQGVKVEKAEKGGIYIINGKKYIK